MTNWKYTDQTRTIVFRVMDDGSVESMLASALDAIAGPELGAAPIPDEPDPPTADQITSDYSSRIDARLLAFVKTRGYDSVDSTVKYAGCKDPQFSAEGTYMRDAVADTWRTCYNILGAVQAGLRPIPTWEQLELELPPLVWP